MSLKPRIKEDPREWKKFVMVLGSFLSLVGYLLYRKGIITPNLLGAIIIFAGILIILSHAIPHPFRPLYRLAMTMSHYMGQVMGKVILTVFFFLVLTPMGLVMRLLGKDLLQLKPPPNASSYWQPAKTATKMDQMF